MPRHLSIAVVSEYNGKMKKSAAEKPSGVPPVHAGRGEASSPAEIIREVIAGLDKKADAQPLRQRLLQVGPPLDPPTAVSAGHLLLEADLINDAEQFFLAMTHTFPGHPGAFAGLAEVAMKRRKWADALGRWDQVLGMPGQSRNVFWLGASGTVLMELGQTEKAADIFAALTVQCPDEPPGYSGLARLAARQRRWPEVLTLCDELLARFGDHADADAWKIMRADALLQMRRPAEAEGIAASLLAVRPQFMPALSALLRAYEATGRHELTLEVLEERSIRENQGPAFVAHRLEALIRLERFVEAGAFFDDILSRAGSVDILSILFRFVPSLYQDYDRQRQWKALIERTDAMASADPPDRFSIALLLARISLALHDRTRFLSVMSDLPDEHDTAGHADGLRRIAVIMNKQQYPDYSQPKIFGIGLSKTGTTALAAALRTLGFHTLHWSNPLTGEVISEHDFPIFDAFLDTPISFRFETLYYLFPNSRFIFTNRPYDSWLGSMTRHWQRHLGSSDFDRIKAAMAKPGQYQYGEEFRVINRSLYFNYSNYREAFEAHEKRVRNFFSDKPRERFLELNILAGEGWPELCAFVKRDSPVRTPFPRENQDPGL